MSPEPYTMRYRLPRPLPLLLTALCLPACIIELDGDLASTIEGHLDANCIGDSTSLEPLVVEESIHTVIVDSGVGDIEVHGHDEPGAIVQATVHGDDDDDDKPAPVLHVDDGVLHVSIDCPDRGCCGAELDLTIPTEARLVMDLGVGDIEVSEFSGSMEIDVGTGEVQGQELMGSETRVDVGTGDVSLSYDASAVFESIEIDVGVGAVDLRVPEGAYDLHLSPGVGDVDVDDLQDGTGPRIEIDVGTGDIDVHGL